MREIIHRLVKDPTLPCMIDGRVIPHGYGADLVDEETVARLEGDIMSDWPNTKVIRSFRRRRS